MLWQGHLPSVICGQGQIKWHRVVPAGSVVPPNYCGQGTGLWFMVGVDEMVVGQHDMIMEIDRILRLIFYLTACTFEYINPSPVFLTFIVPCLLLSTLSFMFLIHVCTVSCPF